MITKQSAMRKLNDAENSSEILEALDNIKEKHTTVKTQKPSVPVEKVATT
jgi:hypothetical protein